MCSGGLIIRRPWVRVPPAPLVQAADPRKRSFLAVGVSTSPERTESAAREFGAGSSCHGLWPRDLHGASACGPTTARTSGPGAATRRSHRTPPCPPHRRSPAPRTASQPGGRSGGAASSAVRGRSPRHSVLFFAFAFAVIADPVSSVAYAIEAALRAPHLRRDGSCTVVPRASSSPVARRSYLLRQSLPPMARARSCRDAGVRSGAPAWWRLTRAFR